jgi:hypothetical protein
MTFCGPRGAGRAGGRFGFFRLFFLSDAQHPPAGRGERRLVLPRGRDSPPRTLAFRARSVPCPTGARQMPDGSPLCTRNVPRPKDDERAARLRESARRRRARTRRARRVSLSKEVLQTGTRPAGGGRIGGRRRPQEIKRGARPTGRARGLERKAPATSEGAVGPALVGLCVNPICFASSRVSRARSRSLALSPPSPLALRNDRPARSSLLLMGGASRQQPLSLSAQSRKRVILSTPPS